MELLQSIELKSSLLFLLAVTVPFTLAHISFLTRFCVVKMGRCLIRHIICIFGFCYLNVPYLSSIFANHWMFRLDAGYLFNQSVAVRLPRLSVNSKKVQNLLVGDGTLQFSLEAAVNESLKSESVYNSLSDYIFDQLVKMKGIGQGAVNWLSCRDWLLFVVCGGA